MNINDQSALVTGAGSGLGEAVARTLAARGARVALLDVQIDKAREVAQSINAAHGEDRALVLSCDITDAESVQTAIAAAAASQGPARILMQIAGIGTAKRVVGKDGQAAPLEDFAKVV